ncbi:MAG: ankyrin repeat domain-containing protein, partial [Bacteroidota bacterium]
KNPSVLLKLKNHINITNNEGETALMIVSDQLPEVTNLLQHGADPKAKDKNGKTTLMYAVGGNNKKVIKAILAKAPNTINEITRDNTTALTLAIKNNNKDVVRLLLENGADPLVADALMYATPSDEILKEFIHIKVDLNQPLTHDGMTPLMIAAQANNLAAVINLLNNGANASLKDPKGNTALIHTIKMLYNPASPTKYTAQIVQKLLQASNNVNEKNNDGDTVLSIAQNYYSEFKPDQQEVLEKILEARPDVTYKSGPRESSFKEFIERKKHAPLYTFYKKLYEPKRNELLQSLDVSLTALNNAVKKS